MKYYGYHRTSTEEQHLDRGKTEINNYCKDHNIPLEKIFTDQQTGKNFDRPRYKVMKEDVLREGDTLIITEVDRLGRNKDGTLKELRYFKEHKIRVMILEIPTTLQDCSALGNDLTEMLMDTVNNMLIEMYATLAHAEMQKKEKRQREGIQAKKERGEWADYGRPYAKGRDEFFSGGYEKVLSGELRPVDLMQQLSLAKPTYYRYKKEYEQKKGKFL